MDSNELLSIYPQANIHSLPAQRSDYLSFPSSKGYIWLDKKTLAPTEIKLLETLTHQHSENHSLLVHEWYTRLFTADYSIPEEGHYRFIQVSFQQSTNVETTSWLNEVREMIPSLVDGFFINKNYALLIEKSSEQILSVEDLAGLFLALDGDFDSYSRVFVGYFSSSKTLFQRIFEEEEAIMAHFLSSDSRETCISLGHIAIDFYAQFPSQESYLLSCLANEWFIDNDLPDLLQTLWKHQGNMSSTAKKLYMHRNTLQYKLDKFQQTSQLNLKDMNDLFLCRLLIQLFIKNGSVTTFQNE